MKEKILSMLVEKFPNERKDGLTQLARTLALQFDDEEKAKSTIDNLTAEGVGGFVKDYRSDRDREFQQASKTLEDSLRKKYNIKDDVQESDTKDAPAPKPVNNETKTAKNDSVNDYSNKTIEDLKKEMRALRMAQAEAEKREITAKYAKKLDKELKEANVLPAYQNRILDQFNSSSFENENDFNSFVEGAKKDWAQLVQEQANAGLRFHGAPYVPSGKNSGVDENVKAYLASKKGNDAVGKSLSA